MVEDHQSQAEDQTDREVIAERLRNDSGSSNGQPLPEELVRTAEQLMRLARQTVDESESVAYREDLERRLTEYDYTARVREEDSGAVLVLHPDEWTSEGTIEIDRIENLDRAIERRLSGVGPASEFDQVEAYNREVVADVEDQAGPIHAANADAFADFMGNHYVRRVDTATGGEVEEFLEEYFPRNAFPSADQRAVVRESLRWVFDVCDRETPAEISVEDDDSRTAE